MAGRMINPEQAYVSAWGLAILAFTVFGCASPGKSNNQEIIPPPGSYYGSANMQSDMATDAINAFDAAALAIANSSELHAGYQSLALRKTAWVLGFTAYLPDFSMSAGTDERLSEYGQDSFNKTLSASIEQTIWDGGRVMKARTLLKAELALAEAELDRKARDTGESAVVAYRAVVAARLRLEIQNSSLSSAHDERIILDAELDLGRVNDADLMEADLQMAGMEISAAESALALLQAESELMMVLGVEALPHLSERFSFNEEIPVLDGSILSEQAVIRSVELAIARHEINKKKADASTARLGWLPVIGMQGIAQVSGTSFPLTRGTWSVGITADFSSPLLDGNAAVDKGDEPPHDSTARRSMTLQPFANPSSMTEAREAFLVLELAEELYATEVEKVRRSALLAIERYSITGKKRDAAAKAYELSIANLEMTRVKVGLGQVVRSELIEAELLRTKKNVDLVDAVSLLVAAERELERMLDIPVGLFLVFVERIGAIQEVVVGQ